jgi:hypothetical protein
VKWSKTPSRITPPPAGASKIKQGIAMPQGDKSSYTDKQKRQAAHVEAAYEQRGDSVKTAEARAWATVNKLSGGGNMSGSGRKNHKLK